MAIVSGKFPVRKMRYFQVKNMKMGTECPNISNKQLNFMEIFEYSTLSSIKEVLKVFLCVIFSLDI